MKTRQFRQISNEKGVVMLLMVLSLMSLALVTSMMIGSTDFQKEVVVEDLSSQADDLKNIISKVIDFSLALRPVTTLPPVGNEIHPGLFPAGAGLNPLLPSPPYPLTRERDLSMILNTASPVPAADATDTAVESDIQIRTLTDPLGDPDDAAAWTLLYQGTNLLDNPPAESVYQSLVIDSITLRRTLVVTTNTDAHPNEGNLQRRKVRAQIRIIAVPNVALRNLGINSTFVRTIEMIGATRQLGGGQRVYTHLTRDNGSLKAQCIEWDLGLSINPFAAPAVTGTFPGRYWIAPVLYYLRDNCTQEFLSMYYSMDFCTYVMKMGSYPTEYYNFHDHFRFCACTMMNTGDMISRSYFPGPSPPTQMNLGNLIAGSPLPAPSPIPSQAVIWPNTPIPCGNYFANPF